MLTRSAKVTFTTLLEGHDILAQGQETARHLWNYTWWCLIGHNEKLRRQRGDDWERFRRNQPYNRYPKGHPEHGYPGFAGMDKALRDYWAAVNLSDRCFTYTLKDFDIAMRSWFSNLKSNPKARPPRYRRDPRPLTFEVGRNAKGLGDWTYRLSVLGGSIPERYAVVKMHIGPGIKMRDIKLIRVNPDNTGTIVYYVNQREKPGDGVAGIDMGIVNLAAVAFQGGESILYKGGALLDSDRYYQKRAKKCKPSNWHKGQKHERQSERNRSYRRKAGNVRKLAMHNVTRSIIDECVKRGVGIIVIGDLKGIRDGKDHGKAGNQKLHAWAFNEMVRQVTYKAEEVGIEVIKVSERNTSKTCHVCGVIGRRVERGNFICRDCGIEINADVNGAFNILNKVSPAPAYAGVGVGADLPGPPSLPAPTGGIGKARLSQISPTFVARFDLRNYSIVQASCNREKSMQS